MADKYIWTGTDWESLQGPQGPEGPSAVSSDAGNASKIGTDGLIYTPVGFTQAQADTRYVELTGDTMTGGLVISKPLVAAGEPLLTASTGSGQAQVLVTAATSAGTQPRYVLRNQRGTLAAPQPLQSGDGFGALAFQATGTDGVTRGMATVSAVARSAQGANGYDTQFAITAVCSDSSKAGASLGLYNAASTGSYFYVTTDTFTVGINGALTTGAGITVKAGGAVINQGSVDVEAGWVNIRSGSLWVTKGNIFTDNGFVRANLLTGGTGCQFESTGVDPTKPSYGQIAKVSGQGSDLTALRVDATCETAGSVIYGVQIVNAPKQANSFALFSVAAADSYIKGNLGINWTTPTVPLEVGGAARIRGALEVTGNITSSGTAHSFAANSIPGTAVAGIVAGTPASGTAAGVAGQVRYDSDYLYVCVSASVWKRIALTAF